MGMYRDQLLPRALDLSMRRGMFAEQRARVTAGLDGEVLEIGSHQALVARPGGALPGA